MTKMFALILALATTAPCPSVSSGAITPDEVSTLAPARLGQRLLGPTRVPIVEAYLYGEALEPPPPAGAPIVTRVALFEQAQDSGEEGFCQKVRYIVRLQPVARLSDGRLPAAKPALVTPTTLYRLKTTDGSGPACEGHSFDFFSASDINNRAIFGVIRELAMLREQELHGKTPDLKGTVDDELAREGHPALGESGPVTDLQRPLREFPVSKVRYYDFRRTNSGFIWSLRAAEWTVDLTYSGASEPDSMAFRRFIPPPP